MKEVPTWLAAGAAVATIAGATFAFLQLVGNDDKSIGGSSTDPDSTSLGPATGTELQQPTTPSVPSETPVSIGLTQLEEQEDVQFEVDAEFGTRNIGGTDYTDAVTGLVYYDNSGLEELAIESKGRFNTMSFTVGIDAEAECRQASAKVSIQQQGGAYLWGPKTVTIDSPRSATISIPAPVQVLLKQASLEGREACGNGEAQVTWGGVVFAAA